MVRISHTSVDMARLSYTFRRNKGKIMVALILVLYFLYRSSSDDVSRNTSGFITTWPHRPFKEKEVKKILLWTPFLAKDVHMNMEKCLQTCKAKCVVTTNKDEISDADAVNFHLSNLWLKSWSIGTRETIRFPEYRRQDQVWVIWNMEPPPHLWGDLKVFNNLFNWTVWYRSDATIDWPYGKAYRLNKTESENAVKDMKNRNFHREKTYEVFGRISNCLDPGRRYRIVRDMQKYLNIDMFGLCYDKPCGNPRDQSDKSCEELMKKYKFYIAFENSHCRDYVTEKYWWATSRDQIPIVNWKGVRESIPIPNSYINIYDFKDIESFSTYLKEVSVNETLYNSYFEWKKTYKDKTQCAECTLCHELHNTARPAQVYSDLDGWVTDDVCEKVGIWNDIMKNIHSKLFWNLGI